MRDEIEDGMGFAGLVPTSAERRAETRDQKLRQRVAELEAALRNLVLAVGELPENGRGTIQGDDLNRAYTSACAALK